MIVSKTKTTKRVKKPFLLKKSVSKELFKKTLFVDLLTIEKLIAYLVILLFVPIIAFLVADPTILAIQTSSFEVVGIGYNILVYQYLFILPLIICISASTLISGEVHSKTIITLVSKPISRQNIVLTKYFTTLLFGLILILLDISIITVITYIRAPKADIFQFFLLNIIYSSFIVLFYSTFAIGISCLIKIPRFSLLASLSITILILIAIIIDPFYREDGILSYERYHTYIFNMNYNFLNIFYNFYKVMLIPREGVFFWQLMRLEGYFLEDYEYVYRSSDYLSPIISLVILLSIAFSVFLIGMYRFKRKDIF